MEPIVEFAINLDFSIRILLALLLGGCVGVERELKQKTAGFKTHILIAVGSAVFTYLSLYMSQNGDPGRLAAAIIVGVGLIATGLINQSHRLNIGVNTASTLWIVAGLGMMCGAGYSVFAILTTIIVIAILMIDHWLQSRDTVKHQFFTELKLDDPKAIRKIEDVIETFNLAVTEKVIKTESELGFKINYRTSKLNHHYFIKHLVSMEGVSQVVYY